MAKPLIHAASAARKWGGEPEDYLEIEDFMDSSKAAFGDNRHRTLTHNSWFIFVVEKCFGHTITNSEGREVSVRDICERHILEDFGNKYIPTVADYLGGMEFQPWMNNGIEGTPPSQRRINHNTTKRKVLNFD